jgi:hypothetical protein
MWRRTRNHSSLKNIALVLCISAIVGCNSTPPEPPLMPVIGSVKVEGQPLAVGWITFYPDEAKGNASTRLPVAEIANDGTYTLTTNGKPGAAAGSYKVVIAATLEPLSARPARNPDGTPKHPNWLTHEKYTSPQSTDLLLEVVENAARGHYDLELTR